MLLDIGGSQESFLLAAKKGLESEEDKKYFEQMIACENYLYFKNLMIKRNMQLEQLAFKMMQDNKSGTPRKEGTKTSDDSLFDSNWKDLQNKREKTEMECAIQMSLAIEEEKKKLLDIEDDDLRVNKIFLFFYREPLSFLN